MSDTVTKIGKSIIQHGRENNRIYLMKLHQDDALYITEELENLASKKKYTKVFAKVPFEFKDIFLDAGYVVEAHVPNFYGGEKDAYFMGKYLSPERKKRNHKKIIDVLETALNKRRNRTKCTLEGDFKYRQAKPRDVKEMAGFYDKIFDSYPFPIDRPSYILETMEKNVEYFGIWHEGELAALASSEKDMRGLNVEMTDFATAPKYRGNSLALYLLGKMDEEMKTRGIKTAYTIARANSYGMNTVFSKRGYDFAGTLIRNTNIGGSIENMNVWYKALG